MNTIINLSLLNDEVELDKVVIKNNIQQLKILLYYLFNILEEKITIDINNVLYIHENIKYDQKVIEWLQMHIWKVSILNDINSWFNKKNIHTNIPDKKDCDGFPLLLYKQYIFTIIKHNNCKSQTRLVWDIIKLRNSIMHYDEKPQFDLIQSLILYFEFIHSKNGVDYTNYNIVIKLCKIIKIIQKHLHDIKQLTLNDIVDE